MGPTLCSCCRDWFLPRDLADLEGTFVSTGLVAFRLVRIDDEGDTVGMLLWYRQGRD